MNVWKTQSHKLSSFPAIKKIVTGMEAGGTFTEWN